MRPNTSAVRLPFVLLVALFGLSGAVELPGESRPTDAGQGNSQMRKEQVRALRESGLEAAAAITGHFIAEQNPHSEREAKTLDHLLAESTLVIVGRVAEGRGAIDASGKTITTDYGVVVERTLKGHAPPSGVVTVSILGGRVGFANGQYAEIRTPGLPRPVEGQRYVLFLSPSRVPPGPQQRDLATGPIYAPVLMSQGMFWLTPERGVAPRARPGHPVRESYAGKPESVLVADVLTRVDPSRRR